MLTMLAFRLIIRVQANASEEKEPYLPRIVLKDTSEYSGYAEELTRPLVGEEIYEIKFNGHKAFADASIRYGELRMDYLGSNGGGAGSELMARLAEMALENNVPLTWFADKKSAKNYYKHIGILPDAKASKRYGNAQYIVKPSDLPALIKRLRKRKK